MYKGYPFSKNTYYRRLRKSKVLGCDIIDVPDRRGKHGNHARGSDHYRWNDGQIVSSHGYVKIRVAKDHPLADPNGYAYEHILVWVSSGRTLGAGDILHHINGNTTDNRLENLERMRQGEHLQLHLAKSSNKAPIPDDLLVREWPGGD